MIRARTPNGSGVGGDWNSSGQKGILRQDPHSRQGPREGRRVGRAGPGSTTDGAFHHLLGDTDSQTIRGCGKATLGLGPGTGQCVRNGGKELWCGTGIGPRGLYSSRPSGAVGGERDKRAFDLFVPYLIIIGPGVASQDLRAHFF